MNMPSEIDPTKIVVTVDTREKTPWHLTPFTTELGTIDTGDYCLAAIPDAIRIERKATIDEFVSMVGRERERWEAELDRLRRFPRHVIVCEFPQSEIAAGNWRGQVKRNAVIGSLLAWMTEHSFLFCRDRQAAERAAVRILEGVAKREYWRLRKLAGIGRPRQRKDQPCHS